MQDPYYAQAYVALHERQRSTRCQISSSGDAGTGESGLLVQIAKPS